MEDLTTLGSLISEHKENTTATDSTFVIGLVCFGLTIPMIVLSVNEEGISFNKILFALTAIFAFIGGIGCVSSYLKNRNALVKLYENGILVEKGGKEQIVLWNDIVTVEESVEKMYMKGTYIYDRYLYTIQKQNGETFELSNMISNIAEIGRVIKAKTPGRFHSGK